jgi:hypothetical protein
LSIEQVGTGRNCVERTTICNVFAMEIQTTMQGETIMGDTSIMQLVVEMGGVMVLAIGATFMVYWNLLGKKHRPIAKQQVSHAENGGAAG